MARSTPRVEQELLVVPASRHAPVQVGSQQWYAWLDQEENGSFFFSHETGSYTARKERRKRGGWYWIAYRSQSGKLVKTYIGRSEDLTLERLREVTARLTSTPRAGGSSSLPSDQRASAARMQRPQRDSESAHLALPTTKFGPPALLTRASRLLERTRLLERLEESLRMPITLVTAPAGFGKTTLLGMWHAQLAKRKDEASVDVAWLSLDERDDEPLRFWASVWRALNGTRTVETGSDDTDIAAPLYSTPQMPIDTVLATLVEDMSKRERPIVLILDDYSSITSSRIHDEMAFLLAHLPAWAHVILVGRSEPQVPLGRARMYGDLLELRADDLRLSNEEIARFLNTTIGLSLAEDELALLEQRTEGWIAGLGIVGMALRGPQGHQGKPADILQRFSGSQRSFFDYFAEEILQQLPRAVQQFLLSTSLLTELTPSLCATILDDLSGEREAREMLEGIERANLFIVPLDDHRQSYRYHALFREFLQERLRQSWPDLIPEIHRRAANWYERYQLIDEAIEHALAGQDMEHAQRLIERAGEDVLWKKGEVGRLHAWLQALPSTESRKLTILYAWALLLGQGQLEQVEAVLADLEPRAQNGDLSLRGEIAAIRARIASFRGNTLESIAYGEQALQDLSRDRVLLRADVAFGLGVYMELGQLDKAYRMLSETLHISQALGSLRTMLFASRYLAVTCQEQGRLSEATAILQQAMHFHGVGKDEPVSGIIHIGLAELLYERNELGEALEHVQRGIELGKQSCEIKVLLSGYCMLASIYIAQGEIEQGRQALWRAETIGTMGNVPWLSFQMTTLNVQLALLQNDVEGVVRSVRNFGLDPDIDQIPGLEGRYELILLSQVWNAQGKSLLVVDLLETLINHARETHQMRLFLLASTHLAAILAGQREQRQATHILNEALQLAEPEGFTRLFLDVGEPIRAILQRIGTPVARRLIDQFDGHKKTRVGPLSERETQVVRMLARGLTNQEIADELVVAVSTAKAHVKHICQKLGAQTRLQAVALARQLGLV